MAKQMGFEMHLGKQKQKEKLMDLEIQKVILMVKQTNWVTKILRVILMS
jgi:hypothetical protein